MPAHPSSSAQQFASTLLATVLSLSSASFSFSSSSSSSSSPSVFSPFSACTKISSSLIAKASSKSYPALLTICGCSLSGPVRLGSPPLRSRRLQRS